MAYIWAPQFWEFRKCLQNPKLWNIYNFLATKLTQLRSIKLSQSHPKVNPKADNWTGEKVNEDLFTDLSEAEFQLWLWGKSRQRFSRRLYELWQATRRKGRQDVCSRVGWAVERVCSKRSVYQRQHNDRTTRLTLVVFWLLITSTR